MCEQSVRVENDQKINNRSVANKENQGGKKCQTRGQRPNESQKAVIIDMM